MFDLDKKNTMLEDLYYSLYHKYSRVKEFIKFGLIRKHHCIRISSLDRRYYDTDTRLLHGCFQLLVDFIEVEKASHQRSSNLYEKGGWKWFLYKNSPWWLNWLVCPRSRKLGMQYLDWEMAIPDEVVEREDGTVDGCPGQSEAAKEQRALYTWWTEVYPNRIDPMDLSGLSEFFDKNRSKIMKFKPVTIGGEEMYESYNLLTDEETEEYDRVSKLCWKLEADYELEEKAMLKRLMDIKDTLWT
jgi:hypothetical protein